jgi:hypothetical protein
MTKQSNPKIWRRISYIVSALIVVVFLCSIVPIPHKIDRTLSGMYWESAVPDFLESSTIEIHGTYYNYILPLFKDDIFQGRLGISNFKFTSRYTLWDIHFRWQDHHTGNLTYTNFDTSQTESIGMIRVQGLFDKVAIFAPQASGTYMRRLISAPASSRPEALELAKSLFTEDFQFE